MATNSNLCIPDDIQFCVLQKLPGKSLRRFMCVNKSWNSMISDPTLLNKTSKHIICSRESLFLMDFEESVLKGRKLKLPTADPSFVRVRASCNGILWIIVNADKEILWNPFTEEHKLLQLEFPWSDSSKLDEGLPPGILRWDAYGLGYDHTINDYKIVCIPASSRKSFLYSVKEDYCEPLELGITDFCATIFSKQMGVSINNGRVLCWPAVYFCQSDRTRACEFRQNTTDIMQPHPIVFKFDLVDRSHVLLPQPPSLSTEVVSCLMEFKGSLSAISYAKIENISHIWLLKEGMDERNYWVKLVTVPSSEYGSLVPMSMTNDEVWMSPFLEEFLWNKAEIYCYDLTKRAFQKFECGEDEFWYQILYVETLSLIGC